MEQDNKMKVTIDTKSYKEKPLPNENPYITNRLRDTMPVDVKLEDIIKAIENGQTVRPGILKEGCGGASDWVEQQLFFVDIDNTNEGIMKLDFDMILDICKKSNLPCCMVYESFSSKPELRKYRIIFKFNEVVKDVSKRNLIVDTLHSLFPQSDEGTKNGNRYYFGTDKKILYLDNKAEISLVDIEEVFRPKIPKYDDTDIEKLKSDFDFMSFLISEIGQPNFRGSNYIKFPKCPICGHNDCFVYYTDTKSFYCYGANGNVGGSIIDYIMYTKKMNIKEAVCYFKADLMGIKVKSEQVIDKSNLGTILRGISSVQLAGSYNWVLTNLFAKGFLSIFFGEGGCGKTWLLILLCLRLINGCGEWLGVEINEKRKVLLLEGDAPDTLIKNRINKLNMPLDDNYFKYVNRIEADKNGFNFNLSSKQGRKNLEVILENGKPEILIIDTLISFIDDEKDAEAIKIVIDDLRKLALKYNCHILICHHSRKRETGDKRKSLEQSDVIGSSIITRLSSLVLAVEKINNIKRISVKKSWFEPIIAHTFTLKDKNENEVVIEFEPCEEFLNKKDEAKRKIQKYLNNNETATRSELANIFQGDFSLSTLKNALKELEQEGNIVCEGNTKNKIFIHLKN